MNPDQLPFHLAEVAATGAEVSIVADPYEVVVDARGWPLTDWHLEMLSHEKDLVWLAIGGCRISNAGVRHLAENKRLRFLDVHNTNMDASVLSIVPELPELRGLDIDGLRGLHCQHRHLTYHPRLSQLDLSNTDIDVDDTRCLLTKSVLTSVNLYKTGVDLTDLQNLDMPEATPSRLVKLWLGDRIAMSLHMPLDRSICGDSCEQDTWDDEGLLP